MLGRVVIAAKIEPPGIAGFGSSARMAEVAPRNSCLGNPRAIFVVALIERAIERDDRLPVELVRRAPALVAVALARGKENIERGVARRDLKFVIAGLAFARLEEHLKDVV